jgi:hypothetical protein
MMSMFPLIAQTIAIASTAASPMTTRVQFAVGTVAVIREA